MSQATWAICTAEPRIGHLRGEMGRRWQTRLLALVSVLPTSLPAAISTNIALILKTVW